MTEPASIPRRLGVAFYDLLVVCALWMLAYFPLIAAGAFAGGLDDSFSPAHLLLRGAIAFAYFGWCWTRGGSTLGALPWRIAVVRVDGSPLTLRDAAARFALAACYLLPLVALELAFRMAVPPVLYYAALIGPFLLGTLWALRDPQERALHERVLATRVVGG